MWFQSTDIKLYKSGYAVLKDYPYFGVGNKNYRIVTSKKEYKKDNYFLSTHPHQFYFELLSEHGIIGSLILLSLLFILVFKNLKHDLKMKQVGFDFITSS